MATINNIVTNVEIGHVMNYGWYIVGNCSPRTRGYLYADGTWRPEITNESNRTGYFPTKSDAEITAAAYHASTSQLD